MLCRLIAAYKIVALGLAINIPVGLPLLSFSITELGGGVVLRLIPKAFKAAKSCSQS
ncbi:MAG: hypothetical protein AAFW70_20050 [Cyanobacteria bacterium J06635_10]